MTQGTDPVIDYWRQLGIVSPTKLGFRITIIGAGGIGSTTAFLLAKMGCSDLAVYDFDRVEPHNIPTQMYKPADLELPKVYALQDAIRSQNRTEITPVFERYEAQSLFGVVIACVDNMKTRAAVWQHVRLNASVPMFIDARMGGQVGHVYVLHPCIPEKIRQYEAFLYPDEDAVDDPCTEQAIGYNVFMISAIIGRLIKSFAMKEELPLEGIVKYVDMTTLTLY